MRRRPDDPGDSSVGPQAFDIAVTGATLAMRLDRLDSQSFMRRRIDQLLEATRATARCRHAVALVVSELFTNAVEHRAGGPVEVEVEVGDHVLIRVGHRTTGTATASTVSPMPPPTSARGRGLAIVDRLSDDVTTDVEAGWHNTTARIGLD